MIRRFTSAQFVPADAGSKDKNPMGSVLLSTPIIAPTNLDRHQILRNFCHELVCKGLRTPAQLDEFRADALVWVSIKQPFIRRPADALSLRR